MAHYRLIFTILILLMFYFGFVFGAGMHLPGIGAKGIGMGGAFRGVADDATAIYWNPAGIAQLDRSQILLKGQLLYNNFTYSPSEIMLQNAHVLREGEQPLLNRSFILGHLFGVLSFPEFPSLKAGLGVYAPLGVGSRWDVMKDHDLDYITEINLRDILPFLPDSNIEITVNELLPEQDFVGFIGAYTISPAISYQITPRMALGFSPLFTYSILEVKMPVMDSVRMEADTGLVFGESRMKGTSYGVHLGLLLSPLPKFKFGLTGKWESPIEYHGSFSETIYKFYNEGLSEILDGGKETTPKVDSQFSLKRPLSMGIGVAYQAHSDLVLSLDLSFTHWSVIDSLNLKTEDGDSVLKSLPLKWKNSLRICGGLDYRISNYSLRAGFFYEPHPPIPQYQNLFLPDMNDRVALNMGFAAYYDHFIIEISNEAEFFGKKDIAEYWEDGELKNVPGTYGGYITDLSLSLTYIF